MARHLSFWIGFFIACLLIVPISVGAWGVLESKIFDWVAILFGTSAAIISLLVLTLLFRDRILKSIFGRAESSIDDVASSVINLVQQAREGEEPKTIDAIGDLSRKLLSWYAWSSMYRWVIQTSLGLLVALGAFAGTVLLFEQTRTLREQTTALKDQTLRFREQTDLMSEQRDLMRAQTDNLTNQVLQATIQNEILTVTLVSQLRQLLISTTEQVNLAAYLEASGLIARDGNFVSSQDGSCNLSLSDGLEISTIPAIASIDAIADLASDGELSAEVRKALGFLINDRSSAVAFGAFAALDKLGVARTEELPSFDRIAVENIELSTGRDLSFTNSAVLGLKCEGCSVELTDSFAGSNLGANIQSDGSIFFEGMFEDLVEIDGSNIRFGLLEVPEEFLGKQLTPSNENLNAYIDSSTFIDDESRGTICNQLRAFPSASIFWSYSELD